MMMACRRVQTSSENKHMKPSSQSTKVGIQRLQLRSRVNADLRDIRMRALKMEHAPQTASDAIGMMMPTRDGKSR